MKKSFGIIFCLLIVFSTVCAQNLLWSEKINQPKLCESKGLIIDKNGNIYSYGSRFVGENSPPSLTDTVGTFIQAYTTNGALLFSKRWKIPFYIEHVEYDGDQYFYFAASFMGTQTIDGITITSRGDLDGAAGKMDLTGHILWMQTYGGKGEDHGNAICLDVAAGNVYIAGSVRDSLFIGNSFKSKSQQSALIIQYSTTGNFLNHKLYDFVPNRDLGFINSGRELRKGPSGTFFLLLDRDGKNWDGIDSVNGPTMGRYVVKLNSNLDTLWSTFIIGPGCYYGWNCKSMKVASGGDVFIVYFCSGKYGGTGKLLRLDGNTGQINWEYSNQDGAYTYIYIDGNALFVTGNEGANGCPCPSNNGGYFVVKKFDQTNALVGETRFSNTSLNTIVKDGLGNLFVTGDFSYDKIVIGPDTLKADSTISYGSAFYYARFLTKMSDVNCIAPVISVSLPSYYGHYYPLCSGDTATLTVSPVQGTFNWSNGATGTQTDVVNTGMYFVVNDQPGGCKAYSLPVDIRTSGVITGSISGNTFVCAGSSNTYNIPFSNGTSSYTWVLPPGWTGHSTSTTIVTTAGLTSGNISVTETSACGTSAAKTLSVTVSPAIPSIPGTISGSAVVCPSSSNTYSVAAVLHAMSYSWTIPSTWTGSSISNSINVMSGPTGGIISVKAENSCGASPVQTKSITVSAINNAVTQTGYTLTANMPGATYQWIDCANSGFITGQTNQSFIPSESGNYAVIITKNNCSDTSACFTVVTTDVGDNSQTASLSIYPNPLDNIVYINYYSSETSGNLKIEIKSLLGQIVYTANILEFQGKYENAIDLGKEKPGEYFIQITTDKKSIIKKIIVY